MNAIAGLSAEAAREAGAWTEALGGLDINPATAPWSPGTIFANLTRAGTNKASGLRWLATHLGLSTDEVMMIGDAENDLAALDAAGVAVVVDSAPDLVKAHADRIVASPDDGGIAQAIRGALASRA